MPKVILGERDRRNAYRQKIRKRISEYISGKMRCQKVTNAAMGEVLDMTGQNFGQKLRKGAFSFDQIAVIFDTLGADPEDLAYLGRK